MQKEVERTQHSHSTLQQSQEQQSQLRKYCRHPNFGRSEQEHKNKGNENKRAKYGLTAVNDQIKLHLRPGAWKHLTDNYTVR